ncbi:P-loop containing nucleoside triphosphate hydrolase protein [Rhodofomes roseus]|uniref:DNA 3'-5' helicase n=1 Tax=Rhodofomes roseus TaxID=34475 RepID=A0ABQ8JZR2_9APHY|nr:P-loop containing nucleoside triphosphate hydrolase protein [Rhodofomes roseus]KAH9829868.1 P-loop containing nucleoside triphosphate hydrolase protein [Rhodofomes roseus]
MVREDSITVVVEPTNYLESDVVTKLVEKGVSSVVINRDTLGDASRDGRDLWNEVKACRYRVITLAPETLGSEAFRRVINDPEFRRRWRVFVMDEAHLCDLWGADFRKAFSDVWTIRSRAPEHVAFMALSASVEPGRQTAQVLRCLGFRRGRYHMDRRDCERININIIFRDVQYAYSGYDFRDLDWLVPENMTKAGDVPKRLVFCETIELGHRVTLYLRSLLPAHLKRVSNIVIRHIHSMNCPDCKKDGFAALMEIGDERRTSLFVATAVLDQGVNIPRLKAVVVFPRGKTAAAVIQEIGRAVREGDEQGEAIIYVPKGDLQAALEYANSDSAAKPGSTKKGTVPKQPAKPTARTAPSASDRQCLSLRLMVAAHARGFCVTRQINIIYGNPGTTHDCGRCSSCMEYPVPLARSLSDSVAAPQSQTSKAKLLVKDVDRIASDLLAAAHVVRQKSTPGDGLFVGANNFLSLSFRKAIARDFLSLDSQDTLALCLKTWRYWDIAGDALWEVVRPMVICMRAELIERHEDGKAKRRARDQERRAENASVHAQLTAVGLANVKRVSLVMPVKPEARLGPPLGTMLPVLSSSVGAASGNLSNVPQNSILQAIPPDQFYGSTISPNRRVEKRAGDALDRDAGHVKHPRLPKLHFKRAVSTNQMCVGIDVH